MPFHSPPEVFGNTKRNFWLNGKRPDIEPHLAFVYWGRHAVVIVFVKRKDCVTSSQRVSI